MIAIRGFDDEPKTSEKINIILRMESKKTISTAPATFSRVNLTALRDGGLSMQTIKQMGRRRFQLRARTIKQEPRRDLKNDESNVKMKSNDECMQIGKVGKV
jgi:hypothetical protein